MIISQPLDVLRTRFIAQGEPKVIYIIYRYQDETYHDISSDFTEASVPEEIVTITNM